MGYQITQKLGRSSSYDNKGGAEFTIPYQIVFDDVVNDDAVVLSVSELPKLFDIYSGDLFSSVSRVAPRQDDKSGHVWTVEVTYSRVSRDQEQTKTNPLDRRRVVEWDTHEYDKALIYDTSGKMLSTSAGDMFSPPPRIEDGRLVATMTYNDYAVPAWIFEYRNAINYGPFTIEGIYVPPGCAKIKRIHVSGWKYENNVWFRQVMVIVELREVQGPMNVSYGGIGSSATTETGKYIDGFQRAEQDAGYYEISSGTHQKIFEQGLELSQPALLNGTGGQLTRPVTLGQEYYRIFDVFPKKDFTLLGFPP